MNLLITYYIYILYIRYKTSRNHYFKIIFDLESEIKNQSLIAKNNSLCYLLKIKRNNRIIKREIHNTVKQTREEPSPFAVQRKLMVHAQRDYGGSSFPHS